MRAANVEGLDPQAPLLDAARQIVRVRTDELYSFIPAALDEHQVAALHDMRIAAKRFRYLLELTEFCFGAYAKRARLHARSLHSVLGEVRDCDVLLDRLEGFAGAADADGMTRLRARWRATRRGRFEQFEALWTELQAERLRDQLFAALDEPPVTLT